MNDVCESKIVDSTIESVNIDDVDSNNAIEDVGEAITNNSTDECFEIPTVKPEDFDKYFTSINICDKMEEDLSKFSKKCFYDFLMRFVVVGILSLGVLSLVFIFNSFFLKSTALLGFFLFSGVCTGNDVLWYYPYKDYLWFKNKGIEKGYVACVTSKVSIKKEKYNSLVLNHCVCIDVENRSDYVSLNKGQAVLIFVKGSEYRVVDYEEFMEIKVERSLTELMEIGRKK